MTRSSLPLAACVAIAMIPFGCGMASATAEPDAGVQVPPTPAPTVQGEKESFEIATWNLENFPKAGEASVERITDIVQRLRLDVIGVQELADTNAFHAMVAQIPGWKSVAAGRYETSAVAGRYNPPVGFMYDARTVVLRDKHLLFVGETTPFPRSPLALEIEWAGIPLIVIVVHLKAMGDNILSNDPNDEEARRKRACDMLAEYIDANYMGRRVIVLGDFNDRLAEPAETNVFQALDSRPDRFYFVDMEIAKRGDAAEVSYPPYGSHIDHILITSELFPAFFTPHAEVQTLTIEGFLQYGWFEYSALVSDHRPVYSRLILDQPPTRLAEPPAIDEHPFSP